VAAIWSSGTVSQTQSPALAASTGDSSPPTGERRPMTTCWPAERNAGTSARASRPYPMTLWIKV